MKDLAKITITFSVPKNISEKALKINKELSNEFEVRSKNKSFSLYDSGKYKLSPHITIYQAIFPTKNKNKVVEISRKITSEYKFITFNPIGVNTKGPYVGVEFELTPDVEKIHRLVVEQLNPLREGNIKPEYKSDLARFSDKERENIENWGYIHVMDLYQPHLTIISLENESDVKIASKRIKWEESFETRELRIAVSELRGKNILKFKLGD